MQEVLFLLGPSPANRRTQRWYETESGWNRLRCDRTLVTQFYPGLTYVLDGESYKFLIKGMLTYRTPESGIPTNIEIRVEFPDDYPESEPVAFDAGNRFPHVLDRHFIGKGQCCLWLPPKSQWRADDPKGVLSFLDQVLVFFDRQLICDALGGKIWPGEQYEHGYKGYVQYLEESLKGGRELVTVFSPLLLRESSLAPREQCPCRSGRKYRTCHRQTVEKISTEFGQAMLREILASLITQYGEFP